MAKVLEFPSQETRAYAFLERELRTLLTRKGADETLIDYAVDALTSVYRDMTDAERFSFQVDLPTSLSPEEVAKLDEQISAGIEELRSHHHTLALKLAARLVLTEMKLFQHEREDNDLATYDVLVDPHGQLLRVCVAPAMILTRRDNVADSPHACARHDHLNHRKTIPANG